MIFSVLVVFTACVLLSPYSWSQSTTENSASDEFVTKKKYNRERVDDFYKRMVDQERIETERRMGADEIRKMRKSRVENKEADRKEFVKTRKATPVRDDTMWEAELKARKLAYDKSQQDYVRRKSEMKKLMKTLGQIPEEDEFDLNTNE